MKSEKLQFDRSLATDSEATYCLRTKSHHSLDAGIGGTFYSIPVDSYRNFRRILLYAAMRTISSQPIEYSAWSKPAPQHLSTSAPQLAAVAQVQW